MYIVKYSRSEYTLTILLYANQSILFIVRTYFQSILYVTILKYTLICCLSMLWTREVYMRLVKYTLAKVYSRLI